MALSLLNYLLKNGEDGKFYVMCVLLQIEQNKPKKHLKLLSNLGDLLFIPQKWSLEVTVTLSCGLKTSHGGFLSYSFRTAGLQV